MILLILAHISFIAIHPNAGVHFSAFASALEEHSIPYTAYGADQAAGKMEGLSHFINITDNLPIPKLDEDCLRSKADALAEKISNQATIALVDVGSPFSLYLIPSLKERGVTAYAYWDNFEAQALGSYTDLAKKVASLADLTLYASAKLSEKYGVGYYPLEDLDQIRVLRKDPSAKHKFLTEHCLDPKLPTLLFLGGANRDYETAFQHFTDSVENLTGWNLLLHRHPRAEEEGLSDRQCIEGRPNTAVAKGSLEEALAFSNAVLYYQTTVALKPLALGIPLAEWGGFEDVFVKERLIEVLDSKETLHSFLHAKSLPKQAPEKALHLVGYRPDWKRRLLTILRPCGNQKLSPVEGYKLLW